MANLPGYRTSGSVILSMRNERGIAVGMVIVMALLFAIGAFAALMSALTRLRISGTIRQGIVARYAAEGGLVYAMQKLWVDPAYCGTGATPISIGAKGYTKDVHITVTPCNPPTPGQVIKAKVTW